MQEPNFLLWDERKMTFYMNTGGAPLLTEEYEGRHTIYFNLDDSMGARSDTYLIILNIEGDPEVEV